MKRKGLKLTYAMNKIEGVRDSIEYEIGDIVYLYYVAEAYRRLNAHLKYNSELCRIIEIIKYDDGLHMEKYGLERIKDKSRIYWFYPTFLEPAFEAN